MRVTTSAEEDLRRRAGKTLFFASIASGLSTAIGWLLNRRLSNFLTARLLPAIQTNFIEISAAHHYSAAHEDE